MANLREQVDVKDITVRCVCGRDMRPLATQGAGHFRCLNCRSRVQVEVPGIEYNKFRCEIANGAMRCDRPKVRGLRICETHLQGILTVVTSDPEQRQQITVHLGERELAESIEAARQKREREVERAIRNCHEVDCPVVYYVRLAPDVIKIGTTVHLPTRMRGLRVFDNEQVLAAEPGDRLHEARRHKQFKHLRYDPRREDFRPEDDLMQHIAAVREVHGPPFEMAEEMLAEAVERREQRRLAEM